MIVFDAGDALVRRKGWSRNDKPDVKELARRKARAELILRYYKQVGAAALGVGPEDLLLGVNVLRRLVKTVGVPMISLNLVGRNGNHVFPGSVLVDSGLGKVGILSALWLPKKPKFRLPAGVKVVKPGPLIEQEVQALRRKGAKFVVLAAAMDMTKARSILGNIKGIDLAVVTGRGSWLLRPQKIGDTYILAVPPGGKHIGLAELHIVAGSLKFEDLSAIVSSKTRIQRMLGTWRRYQSLAQRVSGPQQQRYARRVDNLKKAIKNMMRSLEKSMVRKAKGSFLLAQVIGLDKDIPDDQKIQDMVDKVKSTYDINDLRHRRLRRAPFSSPIPKAALKKLRGSDLKRLRHMNSRKARRIR